MTARFVFTSSTAYLAVTVAEIAATFVSLPIMTRMLSPAEYGLMLLIANTAALINLMFGFSLAQALPTLFARTMSLERRRTASTTILAAIAVVSAALYGTMAICAGEISFRLLQTSAHAEVIAFGALASFLIAFSLCLAQRGPHARAAQALHDCATPRRPAPTWTTGRAASRRQTGAQRTLHRDVDRWTFHHTRLCQRRSALAHRQF